MRHMLLFITLLISAGLVVAGEPGPEKQAIEIGQTTAGILAGALKSHLMQAMQEDGLLEAARFCANEAQTLTQAVNDTLPEGLRVNRISGKYRNPLNEPTDVDTRVLLYFENTLKKDDTLPDYYLHTEVDDSLKTTTYHFYKPLIMMGMCLKCHGQVTEMDADVVALFQEKYPEDHAVNYVSGDFRGAIHVQIAGKLIKSH